MSVGEKETVLGKISREKFIRLGSALGVGAATASVAACGGSGGSGGGSGNSNAGGDAAASSGGANSGNGSNGGANASGGGSAIAQTSEVSSGSAVEFQDGGEDAVLVHLDNGDFVAYSAVCTHAGCTVAYRDGELACPCHGSVFDPANGAEVVTGPAQEPLREIPVSVEGGSVVKG